MRSVGWVILFTWLSVLYLVSVVNSKLSTSKGAHILIFGNFTWITWQSQGDSAYMDSGILYMDKVQRDSTVLLILARGWLHVVLAFLKVAEETESEDMMFETEVKDRQRLALKMEDSRESRNTVSRSWEGESEHPLRGVSWKHSPASTWL